MYICICNTVSERQVMAASREANGDLGVLLKSLGLRPKCGKCIDSIKEMVFEAASSEASLKRAAE